MPSALFVSLTQTLATLKSHLIVTGKDYDKYTSAEQSMALGFRVLASAHIEDYVEKRCVEVAKRGTLRIKSNQPTRTGWALLLAFIAKADGKQGAIPLVETELPRSLAETALEAYERSADSKHGISGRNLKSLVVPLGLPESELDPQLFDLLDTLAQSRGAAAHVRVNRAKGMQPPEAEWTPVGVILPLLEILDDALETAVDNY